MPNKIDLTDKVFARLTVIGQNGYTTHNKARWLCQCICGNKVTVVGISLRNGATKSCGCLKKELGAKPRKRFIYIGKTFGRLTVIKKSSIKNKHICRCICGKETDVFNEALKKGHTKSCGCIQSDNGLRAKYFGITFGKLKVIDVTPDSKLIAQCICGGLVTLSSQAFNTGTIKS